MRGPGRGKASASDPWILLEGQAGVPQYFTIPQGQLGSRLKVGVNGAGMQPDVYAGTVTWTSLDSGQPPFDLEVEVRMDLCRQITGLTPTVVTVQPDTTVNLPLAVNAGIGTTVDDLDVGLTLVVTGGGQGELRGVDVTVVGPSAATSLLGTNASSESTVWDDDTNPPLEPLSSFEGLPASGTWQLRLSHEAAGPLEVTIDRFAIRLHADPSSSCV